MFAELETLLTVASAGSMERAANLLSLTPSALTRRIQRLEAELGLVLIDRRFKPQKLTQAGLEVLEKSRAILSSVSDLKASTTRNGAPSGRFRLGLSHALAHPEISRVIIELGRQFPLLQPCLCSDITPQLLARVRLGELDAALVVLPAESSNPHGLEGVVLSRETMLVVQARIPTRRKSTLRQEPCRRNWVLNPAGCLVREEIKNRMERSGFPFMVAAELHNPDLQLSLIAGGLGVGTLRASFLQTHPQRNQVSVVENSSFNVSIRIGLFYGGHLGTRTQAVIGLQQIMAKHFEKTDKRKKPI